jgi:hypothetical protein
MASRVWCGQEIGEPFYIHARGATDGMARRQCGACQRLVQQSRAVHTSAEMGVGACVRVARQECQRAAWQVEAVPAVREGHAVPRSCRLCLTGRRRLNVASGAAADGATLCAHAAGQNGVIGWAQHMGMQSGVALGARACRGQQRGWQRAGWKQMAPAA